MKVKLIRNPAARFNCELREGETGEVDGDVGKALVHAGIAVSLEEPKPKEVKAIPDKPAIAEAKPAPIKAPEKTEASKTPAKPEASKAVKPTVSPPVSRDKPSAKKEP